MDFRGGFDSKDAPFLLQDSFARDVVNVQGTTAGAIVKRNGLTTFASPAATFTSLFALESTTSLFLVGAGGTALYSVSTGGTVTSIKTGLTAGLRWSFASAPVVSAQGPLFGMNGTDTPQQWSGSGSTGNWTNASGAVSVPNGTMCLYANNQMFAAGMASEPSRVRWSTFADPTNWDPASLTGAGFADFDPNDGQKISAIGQVGPYILVAKPRKLWVIADTLAPTIRQLHATIGIAAHRSLATGPEGAFFLAEDRNIYVTDGTTVKPIADRIGPTVASILDRTKAVGKVYDGHYYLSVPITGSSNDTTLDYDATLGSWWKHGFGSNQFAIWHPGGTTGLYSAKSTSAIVDKAFDPGITVDNGTAFTWRWAGPWQSPSFYRRRLYPTPFFRKRLRQVRLKGYGQVDISYATDFAGAETLKGKDIFQYLTLGGATTFGGGGTYGGPGVFGDFPGTADARLFSFGVAYAFSTVFSSTSISADAIELYALILADRKDMIPT
jgi:hypothetical protein